MSRHKHILDDDENNNKVILISQTKPPHVVPHWKERERNRFIDVLDNMNRFYLYITESM